MYRTNVQRWAKLPKFCGKKYRQQTFNMFLCRVEAFSSVPSKENGFNEFQFETLVEMQLKACELFKDRDALGTCVDNEFKWMTFGQLGRDIQKFRNVLIHHKFVFDDKVAIISNNRAEWPVCAYAAMSLGGQIVPMYEAQHEKDWRYILEDSDSKVLVVATDSIYQKVKDYPGKVGKIESVIVLDGDEKHPDSYRHWMHKVDAEPPSAVLDSSRITPDSLCTIIYTSGTTGRPKGVELCHRNIQSGIYGGKKLVGRPLAGLTSLAFLPWAHIFGMTAELHTMMSTGSRLAIVPHRDKILQCLLMAKPDVILSVPVLFNKVYDGVLKATSQSSPVAQFVFRAAMGIARKRNHALEFGQPVGAALALQHRVADKLVLSKIRAKLGNNLQFMISGGAATSQPVLEFFEDIGVPVMEGYGLTETSPAITAGSIDWSNRRLGCAGVPLEGVTVRIVDPDTLEEVPSDTDGEVTCAGPNVMVGYRKNPKANEEAFYTWEDKRFFRTGDLGRMVEGRFLRITGRIKEQFKLENGKFVIPAPMEDAFCRSPLISQIFVFGQDRPHTVALIVPDFAELASWVAAHKTTEAGRQLAALLPTKEQLADPNLKTLGLFEHPEFRKLVSNEMIRLGAPLKSYERPAMWTAITQPFSQENQMLTPKLSLRRANILKAFQPLVDQLYHEDQGRVDGETAAVEGHFMGAGSGVKTVGVKVDYKK